MEIGKFIAKGAFYSQLNKLVQGGGNCEVTDALDPDDFGGSTL